MSSCTMNNSEFQGRVAVLTGGSSGIGQVLAVQLAQAGCEVFFCGRRPTADETLAGCGPRGHYFRCDITAAGSAEALVAEAIACNGAIDYVINGVATDSRVPFEQATPELFDQFVATDLKTAFRVCQAALDGLRAGRGKSILNFGTTNWMLGLAPFTLYSAAKSGLVGFTRALARELGPEGIRVNLLSPGWVMTQKQLDLYVTEQDKKDLLRDQALPFLLQPEDVVGPAMFLLSSAAHAITGQNLVVDAGKYMQ